MERIVMNIVWAIVGMAVNIVAFIHILERWFSKEKIKNHEDRRMLRFYCAMYACYFPIFWLVGFFGGHLWVAPICALAIILHFFSLALPSRDDLRKGIIKRLSNKETAC